MNLRGLLIVVLGLLGACGREPAVAPSAAAVSSVPPETAVIAQWDSLMPDQDVFQRPPPQIGVARGNGMQGIGGLIDDSGAGSAPGTVIDHSSPERAKQFGSSAVVAAVDGRPVRLQGYLVPLDGDDAGRVSEGLFVPFYGACIHVPPPPPNQVIHVRLAQPMAPGALWDAYRLTGTLHVQRFDADSASASYEVGDAELVVVEDAAL